MRTLFFTSLCTSSPAVSFIYQKQLAFTTENWRYLINFSQSKENRGHRKGAEGKVLLCVSKERKFTQHPLYQLDKLKD